jgi:hypothetical protein
MSGYRIGRLGGRFVLVFESGGKRRRFRLNAKDASEAHRVAPGIFAQLTQPAGTKVKDLWDAFVQNLVGRAVTVTMVHTWKALKDRFGEMEAAAITVADCRAHMAERRKNGIMDGTLLTELGHLRMVLRWAEKHKLIDRAHISSDRLSRAQKRTSISLATRCAGSSRARHFHMCGSPLFCSIPPLRGQLHYVGSHGIDVISNGSRSTCVSRRSPDRIRVVQSCPCSELPRQRCARLAPAP